MCAGKAQERSPSPASRDADQSRVALTKLRSRDRQPKRARPWCECGSKEAREAAAGAAALQRPGDPLRHPGAPLEQDPQRVRPSPGAPARPRPVRVLLQGAAAGGAAPLHLHGERGPGGQRVGAAHQLAFSGDNPSQLTCVGGARGAAHEVAL